MLLLLTNKCFEECTHCMEDSNPEGEHMSWETLKKSIKWINLSGARILSVSGGEFTTDHEFYEKIKYIIDNSKVMKITLQSNGSFLRDEEKIEKIKKLLTYSKINSLQISTHHKYYKNYEWTISHKSDFEKLGEKILFVGDWQGKRGYLSDEGTSLTYLGRAQNLDFTITGKPSCGKILTYSRQIHKLLNLKRGEVPKFSKFIQAIEIGDGRPETASLCKPMIDSTGEIRVGESRFCQSIGNVSDIDGLNLIDTREVFLEYINKMIKMEFCDKCKSKKNIGLSILLALNYKI